MTVEKQDNTAHVWFLNASDAFAIEIYANGANEPSMTDINPLELGPVFVVDDSEGRAFGSYRFEVRQKDHSSGPVLASAAVELLAGCSYAAAFHTGEGGGYQLSVWENDFTPSAATRLELRHAGHAPRIDWRIQPKDGPSTPDGAGVRAGALIRGQWQQCTEMPADAYRLEALLDGIVVAFLPDVQLEAERMLAVTFVGTPQPQTMQSNELRKYWLIQDFRVETGEAGAVAVTPAKPPLNAAGQVARAKHRAPVAPAGAAASGASGAQGDGPRDAPASETPAVNPATGLAVQPPAGAEQAAAQAAPAPAPEAEAEASSVDPAPGGAGDPHELITFEASPALRDIQVIDPKSRVTRIAIEQIEPDTNGIRIARNSVRPAPARGEPARATLAIGAEVAPGSYRVQLKGRKRHGQRAVTHTVPVTVLPVTVQRLASRVAGLRATGGLSAAAAASLQALLKEGGTHLAAGDMVRGQAAIERFGAQVTGDRDGAMTAEARDALARETAALQAALSGS